MDTTTQLWSDRPEARALSEILHPGEEIRFVTKGTVYAPMQIHLGYWLIVVTDRRLISIRGRWAITRRVIEAPLSAILSVETRGFVFRHMTIATRLGRIRIANMRKQDATALARLLTPPPAAGAPRPQGAIAGGSVVPAGVSSAGSAAPSADPDATEFRVERLEGMVERLETELVRLQEQVDFVEELVRERAARSASAQPSTSRPSG